MDVYGKATQLLNELTSRLESTRAGQVDYAAVHPGDTSPAYGCETAFVRPGQIYPTAAFPAPLNPAQIDPTHPVSYAADLEITIFGATRTRPTTRCLNCTNWIHSHAMPSMTRGR